MTLPAPTKTALEPGLRPAARKTVRSSSTSTAPAKADASPAPRSISSSAGSGRGSGSPSVRTGFGILPFTSALDLTKGDERAVQKFSRHKDVRMLNAYDDNRQDLAGNVARLVAGV